MSGIIVTGLDSRDLTDSDSFSLSNLFAETPPESITDFTLYFSVALIVFEIKTSIAAS